MTPFLLWRSAKRQEIDYRAEGKENIWPSHYETAAEKMPAPNRKTLHGINSNSIDQFLAIEVGISAISFIC